MAQPNQSTESTEEAVNDRGLGSREAEEHVESIMNSQVVSVVSTSEDPSPLINRKRNLSEPDYTSMKKARSASQCNDSKETAEIQGDIEESKQQLGDSEGDSGAHKGPVMGHIIASARRLLYGQTPTRGKQSELMICSDIISAIMQNSK